MNVHPHIRSALELVGIFAGIIAVVLLIMVLSRQGFEWLATSVLHKGTFTHSYTVLVDDGMSTMADSNFETEFDRSLKDAGMLSAEDLEAELEADPPADDETLRKYDAVVEDLLRGLELQGCMEYDPDFQLACEVKLPRRRDI